MKNRKLLKLNILSALLVLAISSNIYSDDISLLEQYGPAMAERHSGSTKASLPEGSTILSDYDFNQVNGTGQITSGDIAAIKQIVVAEPTVTTVTSNNIATPVGSPAAQSTQQMATPLTGAAAYTAGVNLANNVHLANFTTKTINTAKVPDTSAPSYALINANTRHIYAVKNQNVKYNPSGLTNLMTAYIATQYLRMDSVLKVNRTAVKGIEKDASIAALDVDDTITLKDALASMFVKGCVDSANVVAENVSNSIEEFVNLMNVTATSLGLTNTHFVDPSGIGKNESTALDMSIIMAKVCENPELVKLLSLHEYVLPAAKRRDKLHLWSKNTQLNKDNSTYNADVAASRLAYTNASKWCISSMMSYYNNNIIAVVLKAEGSQFGDTKKLLEFGKIATTEDLAVQ
jgi:D-alanyl-D-alanine carboxypeptidase